jgi:3-dehydroquinate synthase
VETIWVELGERRYPIRVIPGGLTALGDELKTVGAGQRLAVVTDPIVRSLYGDPVLQALTGAGFAPTLIEVPAGEEQKSLQWATRLWDAFLAARLDRGSAVVAFGGGVIGDLAGFAAATYMRGLPLIQVPTTLLAQVDAAIGGKVGINHPLAKNLIGAFHQPRLVLTDPLVLRSLPEREYRAGLAEVVKYGVVFDAALFGSLEAQVPALLARAPELLVELIARCCRHKARVVAADEREAGDRALLNYGHTVGHALEAATTYQRYLHGEAVSIGMVCASKIAWRTAVSDQASARRQEALLTALGLPTRFEAIAPQRLVDIMAHDKKAREGRIPLILAEEIGRGRLVFDVSTDTVLEALGEIQETPLRASETKGGKISATR